MQTMSDSIKEISKAFLKAQREMGVALKDAKNPFFKSNFADLNSVIDACLGVLNEQDISVWQPTVTIEGRNYVKTLLTHSSGEWLASYTEVLFQKPNDPQAQGSGISYARRYGLQSMVVLKATDNDGESAMDRTPKTYSAPRVVQNKTNAQTADIGTTMQQNLPISNIPQSNQTLQQTSKGGFATAKITKVENEEF